MESYRTPFIPTHYKIFKRCRSLKSHDYVKELIENTTTQKGLTVKAHIIKKVYQTGRKYADGFQGGGRRPGRAG